MMTLKDIAGYVTERNVWKLLLTLSDRDGRYDLARMSSKDIRIVDDAYAADKSDASVRDKDAVWNVGALAFYALMGVEAFENAESQPENAAIPRISSSHASRDLSSLIHACLNHDPEVRPSMDEVHDRAEKALAKEVEVPEVLVTDSGRSYKESLVRFWPEEMVCLLVLVMTFLPMGSVRAQEHGVGLTEKMQAIVHRCVTLREPGSAEKVRDEFDGDYEWTLLDEIAIDKKGECTIKDPVDMFGINEICGRILKYRSGVLNVGDRFVNGQDPRYNYSLIEVTVKAGATVCYEITKRRGTQTFAVIPHDNGKFSVTLDFGGGVSGPVFIDGVCYVTTEKMNLQDRFTLSIANESGKNMSYIIVNHNARD